jgi:hypothetical protein
MTHCTAVNYRRRNEYSARVQHAIDHHRESSLESEDEPESVPVSPAPAAPAVLDAQCPTPENSPSPLPLPDQRTASPAHTEGTSALSPPVHPPGKDLSLGLLYDSSLGVFVAAAATSCSPATALVPSTNTVEPASDDGPPAYGQQLPLVPYVPSPEPVFTALAPAPRARVLGGDPLLPSLRFSAAGDIRATEEASPFLGFAHAANLQDGLTDEDAIGDDDSQLGQMDTGGGMGDAPAVVSNMDALFDAACLSPFGGSLDIDFAFAPPSSYAPTTSPRTPTSHTQEAIPAQATVTADHGQGESLFGRLVRRRAPSIDGDAEDGDGAERATTRRRLN